MDNWIPKIGGVEATRLLKNHPLYRNIPVIYLSANTDIETLAQQAGADSYLAKPFDLEDLENRIAELL
ncbi:CAI-1 autoinducer sensor kinase/phosphatase CqsS [compost metagenome]